VSMIYTPYPKGVPHVPACARCTSSWRVTIKYGIDFDISTYREYALTYEDHGST
jgi:hypothetical protein